MAYAGSQLGGKYSYPRDWDRDWSGTLDTHQNATVAPVEPQEVEPEVLYCPGCGRALGGDRWFRHKIWKMSEMKVVEGEEHACATTEGDRIE